MTKLQEKVEKCVKKVAGAKDDQRSDQQESKRMAKMMLVTGHTKNAKEVYKSVNEQKKTKKAVTSAKKELKEARKKQKSMLKNLGLYNQGEYDSDSDDSSSEEDSDEDDSDGDSDSSSSSSSSTSSSSSYGSGKSKKKKKRAKKKKRVKDKKNAKTKKKNKQLRKLLEEQKAALGVALGGEDETTAARGAKAASRSEVPPGSTEKVRAGGIIAQRALAAAEVDRLQAVGVVSSGAKARASAMTRLMAAGAPTGRATTASARRHNAVKRMRLESMQEVDLVDASEEDDEEDESCKYDYAEVPGDVDWRGLVESVAEMDREELIEEFYKETGKLTRIEGSVRETAAATKSVRKDLAVLYSDIPNMSVQEYADAVEAYREATQYWPARWEAEQNHINNRADQRARSARKTAAPAAAKFDSMKSRKATERKRKAASGSGARRTPASSRSDVMARAAAGASVERTVRRSSRSTSAVGAHGQTFCVKGHANSGHASLCKVSGCGARIQVGGRRANKRGREENGSTGGESVEGEFDDLFRGEEEEEEPEEEEEDERSDSKYMGNDNDERLLNLDAKGIHLSDYDEDELGDNYFEAASEYGLMSTEEYVNWGDESDIQYECFKLWTALREGRVTDTSMRGVVELMGNHENCVKALEIVAARRERATKDGKAALAKLRRKPSAARHRKPPKSKPKSKSKSKSKSGVAAAGRGEEEEAEAAEAEESEEEEDKAADGEAAGGEREEAAEEAAAGADERG